MDAWVAGKLAYVPIAKNASTTFTRVFKSIGWEKTQLDLLDDSHEVFGHIQDPLERHLKGTVTFLIQHRLEHLIDDPAWQRIWATAVMDLHGYPITWSLGPRAEKNTLDSHGRQIRHYRADQKISLASGLEHWRSSSSQSIQQQTKRNLPKTQID